MGSSLRSSDGKGGLVERSVFSAYKSQAGDCFPDALSEQGGRDQVQVLGLEGQGDYSLVSEHEDLIVSSTYLRTGQCRGGSPLLVLN